MKATVDLTTHLGTGLILSEPLWIASSHLTSSESAIDAWESIRPAALTLKTSKRNPVYEPDKVPLHEKLHPTVGRYGKTTYCDGPKHEEFHTYPHTARLLCHAQQTLRTTILGISVLAAPDEDYDELRAQCPTAHFAELNLKYSLRVKPDADQKYLALFQAKFEAVLPEIAKFTTAFSGLPIFVKLPRDLPWQAGTVEQERLIAILAEHTKAGLIIANSRKENLAPLILDGNVTELRGGVVCGEVLFDSTIALIETFSQICAQHNIPIVASGGLITEEQILIALKTGAAAAQLCTTFDYNKPTYYSALREMLHNRVHQQGVTSLADYCSSLRTQPQQMIFTTPFTYYRHFWSPEAQMHMEADILQSQRMDVFVMSGHSLFTEWKEVLGKRFTKGLGMRLFIPDAHAPAYAAIQEAWGYRGRRYLKTRQARLDESLQLFEKLWHETRPVLTHATAAEKKKQATVTLVRHPFIPFYSFYIFDHNVYVAPYTFVRTNEKVPAYVFFGGREEYARIAAELEEVLKNSEPRNITLL
jgi:dihydroorotate dehydrogenase